MSAPKPPNTDLIPEEFWVSRQGKWSVLYAGLINYAHKVGLKKIETNLIQIPNEQTNRVAIMMATVTLADDRVFTGFGDAAPNNVAPAMQTCLLRMAETRAKARALRDAVNIGAVAYEELPGEEETGQRYEKDPYTKPTAQKQDTSALQVVNGGANSQTDKQPEKQTFSDYLIAGCKAAFRENKVTPTPTNIGQALNITPEDAQSYFNSDGKFIPNKLLQQELFRVTFYAAHGEPLLDVPEKIDEALTALEQKFLEAAA